MKNNRYAISFLGLIMISILSFKGPAKVNIWIIGDSTAANKKAEVALETGWGMVLQESRSHVANFLN